MLSEGWENVSFFLNVRKFVVCQERSILIRLLNKKSRMINNPMDRLLYGSTAGTVMIKKIVFGASE
ncbi:MAG: hypothetical protein C4527_10890 [Candidatus Omnitrophota bacterium]|nr:MAG: hypothetical protein C4527_10890 [Candidatus Omnitrophota bacterium]